MIELLFALFRGLLPFLKESFLEGGTGREWLKRNRIACCWLLFHLVMLGVTLNLAKTVYVQSQRIMVLTGANSLLATRNAELDMDLKSLHGKIATTELLLEEADAELSRYKGAATMCGVTVTTEGRFQCPRSVPPPAAPAALTKRRNAPAPVIEEPPTVVEDDKPTFGERLRSIFGSKKE